MWSSLRAASPTGCGRNSTASSSERPGSTSGFTRSPEPSVRPLVDPPEPGLPPVGKDSPGARAVVCPGADDAFKDDAVALDVDHPAALLVDDVVHAAQHLRPHSAVMEHFGVEPEPSVTVALVEGGEDLLPGFHLDGVPRLQPEGLLRVTVLRATKLEGVRLAVVDEAEARKEPGVYLLELVEETD